MVDKEDLGDDNLPLQPEKLWNIFPVLRNEVDHLLFDHHPAYPHSSTNGNINKISESGSDNLQATTQIFSKQKSNVELCFTFV
jgi:hypothetical protein